MTTLLADDGVRLDYTEAGDAKGRPVVLIAGFKAPATSWTYQVPELAKAGFRTEGNTPPANDVVGFAPLPATLSVGDDSVRVSVAGTLAPPGSAHTTFTLRFSSAMARQMKS